MADGTIPVWMVNNGVRKLVGNAVVYQTADNEVTASIILTNEDARRLLTATTADIKEFSVAPSAAFLGRVLPGNSRSCVEESGLYP